VTLSPKDIEAGRLANLAAHQREKRSTSANPNRALPFDARPIHVANAKTALPDLYVGMNKTELRRAQELEAMKRRGEIAAWWYEGITLKLGHDTRFTPDFLVQELDGSLGLEEVKGYMRDDARVKLSVCRRQYPFPLSVLIAKRGGGWHFEVVQP